MWLLIVCVFFLFFFFITNNMLFVCNSTFFKFHFITIFFVFVIITVCTMWVHWIKIILSILQSHKFTAHMLNKLGGEGVPAHPNYWFLFCQHSYCTPSQSFSICFTCISFNFQHLNCVIIISILTISMYKNSSSNSISSSWVIIN